MKTHNYKISTRWTGNDGAGTASYKGYRRDFVSEAAGKATIDGSSDPHFRGDAARYNPEDLFVASLSSCHMLWYLHLCSENGVVVAEYRDEAEGVMELNADGSGQFRSVTLHPVVKLASGEIGKAKELHHRAHSMCFIARSVKVTVAVEPEFC